MAAAAVILPQNRLHGQLDTVVTPPHVRFAVPGTTAPKPPTKWPQQRIDDKNSKPPRTKRRHGEVRDKSNKSPVAIEYGKIKLLRRGEELNPTPLNEPVAVPTAPLYIESSPSPRKDWILNRERLSPEDDRKIGKRNEVGGRATWYASPGWCFIDAPRPTEVPVPQKISMRRFSELVE